MEILPNFEETVLSQFEIQTEVLNVQNSRLLIILNRYDYGTSPPPLEVQNNELF